MRANKVPLPLRMVRWIFPKLEWVSSRLAVRYFEKIFFTPLQYRTPFKEREFESNAHFFDIDWKRRIQGYEWGDSSKPYVLVIHGWAGRATQFRKFIPALLDHGYRVIGFDGPAHGRSEGKRTNLYEFEEVLRKIVEMKGAPEAILAHSFGGGVALYAIMKGLPVRKLINIASPTIADEIVKSYLNAIGGSWKTGAAFKRLIHQKYGKPFEEFTSMHFIKEITDLNLLLVHDADDKDVSIVQAEELIIAYPKGRLLTTHGLGHNRVLKDDKVISACLDFMRD
ncbi:MAG: alpha/beta fold hydrolase [Cyclobacteriaceae bacterium]|nr:alpha/beta fold hydrolase [Cyclobacteriaceae bacterium]